MKVLSPGYKLGHIDPNDKIWRMGYSSTKEAAPESQPVKGGLEGKLPRTLPAGRYLVFMTTFVSEPKKSGGTGPVEIQVSLGDSMGTLKMGRGKFGFCRAIVDAAKPFDTVRLAVRSPVVGLFFGNFYLSNQLCDYGVNSPELQHQVIYRDAVGLSERHSVEPDNWIANGSFEVGTGNFGWSTSYQCCYTISPDAWSADNPADGQRSLCLTMYPSQSRFKGDDPNLTTNVQLFHKILWLNPGTTYRFRGMFHGDQKTTILRLSAEAFSWTGMPNQGKKLASKQIPIGKEWEKVEIEFTTPDNFCGYVLLQIRAIGITGPDKLWIDALTLSAKPTEKFVPAAPVEVGVHWTELGKVFQVTDPPKFTLLARNYSPDGAATVHLRTRVVDYWGQTILDRTTKDWSIPAGETGSRELVLKDSPTGVFRLLLDGTARTADGKEITLPTQEYVFDVFNKPPDKMHHTFGVYTTVAPQPVETFYRAGVRKIVTLACSNELLQDWNRIEPKQGEYIWADQRVANAVKHDVVIIANLHLTPRSLPKWAIEQAKKEKNPLHMGGVRRRKRVAFSREAWAEFVEKLTAHYKGSIQDWLIVDEPYAEYTAEDYAELLKVTYKAAKRGDPNCRVIAHGGYYAPWLPALEKAGAVPYFDGISDYARSRDQGERLRAFAQKHGKFVTNVEYNYHYSMYRDILAPRTAWARVCPSFYQISTDQYIVQTLQAMCWSGSSGYNRYDARYPGGDMSQLDAYKCLFEYDGALKPIGAAHAIISGMLDGFHGVGQLELNSKFRTFLLEDDMRFAIMCVGTIQQPLNAEAKLPSGVKALDMMGNPIDVARDGLLLTGAPVFLIGPKGQLSETRKMLTQVQIYPVLKVHARTVLDKKTGQYVLKLTLQNLQRQPLGPGQVWLTRDDPRVAWWQMPSAVANPWWQTPEFPEIQGGKSVEVDVKLNAYKDEKPVECPATLYITANRLLMQASVKLYESYGRK